MRSLSGDSGSITGETEAETRRTGGRLRSRARSRNCSCRDVRPPPRAPRPFQHKRRAVPGAQDSARISATPNSSADGGRQPHARYYDPPIATGLERISVLAARADPPVLPFMSEHAVPTRASAERSTDRARTIIRLAKRRPMSCRAGRMPPRRYLFQNSSAPHRRGASRQQRRAGGAKENERSGQRQAVTLPPTTLRNPADRRTYYRLSSGVPQPRAPTGKTHRVPTHYLRR